MQYPDIKSSSAVRRAGYFTDMLRQEYDDHPAINCSLLKRFMRSSLHADHDMRRHEQPHSDALIFGSAVHTHVLEPHLFDAEFYVMPEKIDRRTKVGKEAYAKQMELSAGKSLLRAEQYAMILSMAESLRKHPAAADLLCCGDAEASIVTDDNFRCRIDRCDQNRHILVDLKTCLSADLPSVQQSVRKFHYAMQARHYLNCYENVVGTPADFYFVFIEKAAPYDISCIRLSEDWLAIGQAHLDTAMKRLQEWKLFGPRGYSETITTLEVPSYLMKDTETTGETP